DLIIANGSVGRFVELTAAAGRTNPQPGVSQEIRSIVRDACSPAISSALGIPLWFRLPRVSSDRARRLIENWQELPPGFFLPLGSMTYLQAILAGISAGNTSHKEVGVLVGGVSAASEFAAFEQEAERVGLRAGAVIQNVIALDDVLR